MSNDHQTQPAISKRAAEIYEELKAAQPLGKIQSADETASGSFVLLDEFTYSKAVEESIRAGVSSYVLLEGGACVRLADIIQYFENPFKVAAIARPWPQDDHEEELNYDPEDVVDE